MQAYRPGRASPTPWSPKPLLCASPSSRPRRLFAGTATPFSSSGDGNPSPSGTRRSPRTYVRRPAAWPGRVQLGVSSASPTRSSRSSDSGQQAEEISAGPRSCAITRRCPLPTTSRLWSLPSSRSAPRCSSSISARGASCIRTSRRARPPSPAQRHPTLRDARTREPASRVPAPTSHLDRERGKAALARLSSSLPARYADTTRSGSSRSRSALGMSCFALAHCTDSHFRPAAECRFDAPLRREWNSCAP